MTVLSRPLLRAAQRFDLEDWEALLSAIRTDSKFWQLRFLSEKSYIIKGFAVTEASLGQTSAQVVLDGSTLINADHTDDFSWYTAELGAANIVIPTGTGGLLPGRNFVELTLGEEEGTPLQRAFWDPSANSGAGVEFTNEVNTMTDLNISVVVNQVSFNSGDPTKIPLAIIDVDTNLVVKGIQDRRELFFRLGQPDDLSNSYSWGSQSEPTTKLTFTSPAAIPYVVGEQVGFTSGATATVVVGGTQDIEVAIFSNINYEPGDSVVGATSGATAVLEEYYESFTGADKDISNFKNVLDALMTEIKVLKGTSFWYEVGNVTSLPALLDYLNSMVTPISQGARFLWSGSALSLTDDMTSGQATSDVIAAIRTPGLSTSVHLTRQDGTGGSTSITIPDDNILYVELPDSGNRTFSEEGPGATNYRVVARGDFTPTDKNLVLAYREGQKLVVKGLGELQPGEETEIGDGVSKNILAFIGAMDESDSTPTYTSLPDPSLSNQYGQGTSLVQSISVNTANINDIVSGLQKVYWEQIDVISTVTSDPNEIQGPVLSGSTLTLPPDQRDSNAPRSYLVGNGALMVFLNGQQLFVGEDYLELGVTDTLSDEIMILFDMSAGDRIEFRILVPEIFGTASLPQDYFLNYITGQNGSIIPTGDLYNQGTEKLMVFRNGLAMINTISVGDLVDRYQEVNNNSIQIYVNADPSTVFTMLNREDPAPSKTLLTGLTGTVITVPTYTMGDGSLQVYKNGVLLSTDPSANAAMRYSETSTTSITLATAAVSADVFQVVRVVTAPVFREYLTGATGTVLTIPNSETYTMGDQLLLVYRNGILLYNSLALGNAADRYQETSTTQITLEEAAVATETFEFIYG